MRKVHKWKELAKDFNDGIVLGNGASCAVDTNFSYSSLYEYAGDQRFLGQEIRKVFEHFGNERDFEFVLRMLWHAYHVNRALDVKENATKQAYERTRMALVKTVRAIHPKYEDVEDELLSTRPEIFAYSRRSGNQSYTRSQPV